MVRHRDEEGHIARVTFTCEGQEYRRFLAGGTGAFFDAGDERADIVAGDLDLVAGLYRRHVDPMGWTSTTCCGPTTWPPTTPAPESGHLRAGRHVQPLQPLEHHPRGHAPDPSGQHFAGVFTVVGRAAVLGKDSRGHVIDDAEALVSCSGFGEPTAPATRRSVPA